MDWQRHRILCKQLRSIEALGQKWQRLRTRAPKSDEKPNFGDTVEIYFSLRLANGELVQQFQHLPTIRHNGRMLAQKPLRITLGQQNMIPAFEECLLQMSKGESCVLVAVANACYGDNGVSAYVAPKTPLLADIRLVDIISKSENRCEEGEAFCCQDRHDEDMQKTLGEWEKKFEVLMRLNAHNELNEMQDSKAVQNENRDKDDEKMQSSASETNGAATDAESTQSNKRQKPFDSFRSAANSESNTDNIPQIQSHSSQSVERGRHKRRRSPKKDENKKLKLTTC